MNKKLGIIGCGNMGEAILRGILESGLLKRQEIIVSTLYQEHATELKDKYQIDVTLDNQQVLVADYIILGIKPKDYVGVLTGLKDKLHQNHILITLAPGFSLEKMYALVGSDKKCVRTMPNTPAMVGAGATGIVFGKLLSKEETCYVRQIFESFSRVIEVEEYQMAGVGSLSGSSPAFLYMLVEAMADVGIKYGLSRQDSYTLAAATLEGVGKMVLDTGLHPGVLKDMVTSPMGTTIEGCIALEQGGFRGMIQEAMIKSGTRFKELEEER